MAAPLSLDLRVRIVRLVEAGWWARRAAERFEVSRSAAIKLLARVRRTASAQPGRLDGNRRPVIEPHADLLRDLVAKDTGITLDELCRELATRGIATSRSALHRMLRRLGLTLKKSRSGLPGRTART